jgi:hypothetical protein
MSDRDPITGRPASAPPTSPGGGQQDRSGQAKAKAEDKAQEAKVKAMKAEGAAEEHARNVGEAAVSHASEVTDEAMRQASHLVEEGAHQIRAQAEHQTERAADYLHDVGGQLRAMARGEQAPEGMVADLVQEGARRVDELADRLQRDGLEGTVHEVQRFARRRPGLFLASAFGAGMAVGRLLRNSDRSKLTGNGHGDGQSYGQRGVRPGAELQPSRAQVPATMATGTAAAASPGAPTMAGADPMTSGDPTGMQGGRR